MRAGGYTLIEMVLVVTLVGIIASVGALGFMPVLDSWSLGSSRAEISNSAGYALQRMQGEMAQLRDVQSVLAADGTTFSFVDTSDTQITFSLDGTNLMRNDDILARNVSALAFSYFDADHAALPTPQVSPSDTDIWRIVISLTGQAGDQSISLEGQVRPRNIPRPEVP